MDIYYSYENYDEYYFDNNDDHIDASREIFADIFNFFVNKFYSFINYFSDFYYINKLNKLENNKNVNETNSNEETQHHENNTSILDNDEELGCRLVFNHESKINKTQSEIKLKSNYLKIKKKDKGDVLEDSDDVSQSIDTENNDNDNYEILDFTNKDNELYLNEIKKSRSSYF